MKRRSFLQQMLRAGVAAMAAPLILREVIRADMPTAKLNLPEIFAAMYAIKRERERDGYYGTVHIS